MLYLYCGEVRGLVEGESMKEDYKAVKGGEVGERKGW